MFKKKYIFLFLSLFSWPCFLASVPSNSNFFQNYLESESLDNAEDLQRLLDANLATYLRKIKALKLEDERRLALERLYSVLGFSKKRSFLLFESRKHKITQRESFTEPEAFSKAKFLTSLKEAILASQFQDDFRFKHPELKEAIDSFFAMNDIEGLIEVVPDLSTLLYPHRSHKDLHYYPWPSVIDPRRVHSLQILWVEKGHSAKNAFGHSAIRIVMCDPKRPEITDECLQDLSYHLVLSFRAQIPNNSRMNPFLATKGDYPSRAFLNPLSDVLSGYDKENRYLLNFRLKFSEEEKAIFLKNLITRMAQDIPYEFFSNNCATECLNLIKASAPRPRLFKGLPLSPDALLDTLKKAELIDGLWPTEKKLKALDLLKLEAAGQAFVPLKRKNKFHFKQLELLLLNNGLSFNLSFENFEKLNAKERLGVYQDSFLALKNVPKLKGGEATLWASLRLIEKLEQAKKQSLENSLAEDVALWHQSFSGEANENEKAFLDNENSLSELYAEVLESIKAQGPIIFANKSEGFRQMIVAEEEAREKLGENWLLKRKLDFQQNHELNEQIKIFLWLYETQNPPPQSANHEPDDNISHTD